MDRKQYEIADKVVYPLKYVDPKFVNYGITKTGRVWSYQNEKYLNLAKDKNGYYVVHLSYKGKTHLKKVHRLVAGAFIPNPENKEQVNHKDGDILNNWWENLEWNTHLENAMHAVHSGLYPHQQMTEETAHKACQMLELGNSVRAVAKELDVPYSTISSIQLRKSWCHISSQYKLPPIRFAGPLLNEKQKKKIRALIKKKISVPRIAKRLKVTESQVNMIRYAMMYEK